MTDNTTPPRTMLDLVPSLKTPGFRLVDAGELYNLLFKMVSASPSVIATGTTRATAKQLTTALNSVLNASATQNSLILPPAVLGQQVTIVNNTPVALNIWPFNATDFIIPAGSSTPAPNAAQAANTTGAYTCIIVNAAVNPIVTYWKQTAAL